MFRWVCMFAESIDLLTGFLNTKYPPARLLFYRRLYKRSVFFCVPEQPHLPSAARRGGEKSYYYIFAPTAYRLNARIEKSFCLHQEDLTARHVQHHSLMPRCRPLHSTGLPAL